MDKIKIPLQDLSKPSVPEVSIILDESSTTRKSDSKVPQSYKEWKQQQNQLELQAKQQFGSPILSDATNVVKEKKKNVTFQSPTLTDSNRDFHRQPIGRSSQSPSPPNNSDSTEAFIIRDSIQKVSHHMNSAPQFECQSVQQSEFVPYENNFSTLQRMHGSQQSNEHAIAGSTKMAATSSNDNNEKISLDHIYQMLMNLQMSKQTPNTQSAQLNDFNRETNERYAQNMECQQYRSNQMNERRMSPHANSSDTSDTAPNTRDLFNIVVKQQEQLMNIQKQIHMLLVHTMNAGDTTNIPKVQNINNSAGLPTNIDHTNRPSATNSIGLMTSLEINVQRNNAIKQCGCKCECNDNRLKYGHTSESDNSDQENLVIPSSNNGNMQKNWMFYGNVLNQVNEVLEKTSPKTNKPTESTPFEVQQQLPRNPFFNDNSNDTPNRCSAKVKQFGFQIDDVNISARSKRY